MEIAIPKISALTLLFFRRIVRGYFRRHFHAVRISGAERLVPGTGPLIIYANHSSWWDPMVSVFLGQKMLPTKKHYAPMDALSLDRYPIFKRLGIFPVHLSSTRGAVQFLRMGEAILQQGGVLWVTPQGKFVDTRETPLEFKPGLAALARRVAERCGSCTLIPLAIEYPFWNERLPETLLHIGQPVKLTVEDTDASATQEQVLVGLEAAMEDLRELALMRDGARFMTLMGGRTGTGGFYGLGQRIKAFLRRRPYQAEHTAPAGALTTSPEPVGDRRS